MCGEIRAREALDNRQRCVAKCGISGVREGARFAKRIRARVERIQVGAGDGPTALGNVVPDFEINRVEGHAATTPYRRGPAQTTLPITIRRAVQPLVDDRAGIQILSRRLFFETT